MSTEYLPYIGGNFKSTDKKLEVINPYTGEVFANTFLAGEKELEIAIEKANAVKKDMAEMPSYKRYEILMQIASEIKKNKEHLTLVLSRESGKPYKYASVEIERAIQTFTVAAEESRRLPKEYISLDWTAAGENKEGLIKYFPIGLIAGITPFNFPINLAAHKIAPAFASGNPIILKPASATPISCLELAKIIDKTDLPKGAFSVLPMDRKAGNQLVTDDRFKLLTFTGSAEVGWEMKKNAGKKKVVLELGGNAGVIITPSADIKKAVKKCVTGSYAYSGQVCIRVQRIFVQDKLFKDFAEQFIGIINTLKRGNPEDPETDISVMIDQKNADRVEDWVNTAVNNGAVVLCGGKKDGKFYEPTVLTNTNKYMKVSCEEVFGPVVTLEPYNTFEDAVSMINDTEYGLQAGVFSNELSEMNYAFRNIEVGGLIMNDVPTLRVDHMPYGGIKDSGFGREGLKYAIQDMMEAKILITSY